MEVNLSTGKSSINRKKIRRAKQAKKSWDRSHPSQDDPFDHFGMDDDERELERERFLREMNRNRAPNTAPNGSEQ